MFGFGNFLYGENFNIVVKYVDYCLYKFFGYRILSVGFGDENVF